MLKRLRLRLTMVFPSRRDESREDDVQERQTRAFIFKLLSSGAKLLLKDFSLPCSLHLPLALSSPSPSYPPCKLTLIFSIRLSFPYQHYLQCCQCLSSELKDAMRILLFKSMLCRAFPHLFRFETSSAQPSSKLLSPLNELEAIPQSSAAPSS